MYPALFVTAAILAKGPFGSTRNALTVPLFPLIISNGRIKLAVGIRLSLSEVVEVRAFLARKILSTVEGNFHGGRGVNVVPRRMPGSVLDGDSKRDWTGGHQAIPNVRRFDVMEGLRDSSDGEGRQSRKR